MKIFDPVRIMEQARKFVAQNTAPNEAPDFANLVLLAMIEEHENGPECFADYVRYCLDDLLNLSKPEAPKKRPANGCVCIVGRNSMRFYSGVMPYEDAQSTANAWNACNNHPQELATVEPC